MPKKPNYTPAQEQCIKSVDSTLVISAAAGTGKTFTLSQKIAYMMSTGFLDSIDQVLAITFTEKAAAEIKSRVRSTLHAYGKHSQALLVDGAWISTIHGMCSRILRSHCIELGIDPGFSVIGDMESSELLTTAINDALRDDSALRSSDSFDYLFREYPVRGAGFNSIGVFEIVNTLITEAKKSPDSFDSIHFGPRPMTAEQIATNMAQVLQQSLEFCAKAACNLATFEKCVVARRSMYDALQNALQDSEVSIERVAAALNLSFPSHKSIKSRDDIVQRFDTDVEQYNIACSQLCAAASRKALEQALEFAKIVRFRYDELKHEQSVMDNDDLLVSAYYALRNNPHICEEYNQQFKLIMVDEFQDTSELQIQIFEMLRGQQAQLCTVGDAQQSIYRFRGADVNVYDQFIRESGVLPVKLDLNFRSHSDVLGFANKVFEQPHVFGDRFLRLEHGRRESGGSTYCGKPRINLSVVGFSKNAPQIAWRRKLQAEAIAKEFAELRENGCSAGDMVVLLGSMSNVDLYSQALQARGFEVVISGGSTFWKCDECKLISFVLRVLANTADTEALYGLLDCGLVPMGAQDLVALIDGTEGKRRRLDTGFWNVDSASTPQLQLLKNLVASGIQQLGKVPVGDIVEQILSDAGYFDRLQSQGAQGSAKCANVLKALRFIRQFEQDDCKGIVNIANTFATQVATGGREAPGALMTSGTNAVRIMTIHSSKGLQFPVVAVAEFDRGSTQPIFRVVSHSGSAYACLKPGNSMQDVDNVKNAANEAKEDVSSISINNIDDAHTTSQFEAIIKNFDESEQLGETRRLMYVALTRAEEALIVAFSSKDGDAPKSNSLVSDFRTGIFGEDVLPAEHQMIACEGTQGISYRFYPIAKDEDGNVVCTTGELEFSAPPKFEKPTSIPQYVPRVRPNVLRQVMSKSTGLFSYSLIAPHRMDVLNAGGETDDAADYAGNMLMGDEDSATELGLAFHSVAEYMVLAGCIGGPRGGMPATGQVEHPGLDRVSVIASRQSLTANQQDRLADAVACWVQSAPALRAATFDNVQAEVPFCMQFDAPDIAGGPYVINGEIDLYCTNSDGSAYIVDYKTGGTWSETQQELHEKHLLQAMCYSYAVLTSGIKTVQLDFVRVERVEDDGQPQVVSYEFSQADLQRVHQYILNALINSDVVQSG